MQQAVNNILERVRWLTPGRRHAAGPRAPRTDELDLLLPQGWPDSNPSVHWWFRPLHGELHHGTAMDLAELPPATKTAHTRVWTPPRETVIARTRLPTRSHKKIAQALPYAFEDQLLDDPKNLHFAYVRQRNGDLAVATTTREHVCQWLEILARAGLHIATMRPAYLAVPYVPGCWSLAFAGDAIWLRSEIIGGFSCPASSGEVPSMLIAALREAEEQQRAPKGLTVFQPPKGFDADAWAATIGLPVEVENRPIWDVSDPTPAPLNLLQGEFAPAGQFGQLLRPLLPATAMLALWLVGSFVFDLSEWWRLRAAEQKYTTEMRRVLQSAFPETKTIIDPAQQLAKNLELLRSRGGGVASHDFLPLLYRVSTAIRSGSELKIQTLSYSDTKLTLDLTAPNREVLDVFRNALKGSGLDVETLTINNRPDALEGRLRIQAIRSQGSA